MRSASEPSASTMATPRKNLSVVEGIAILVGVVIGIGIFGFPPLVAQQVESAFEYMSLWILGGAIALVGALCYAELGSTYPHAGGEYHFLRRAWGSGVGVMFAWARGTVIQTGSIAAVAFIYGEYAQQLLPLGPFGVALHAALAVIGLTLLNMRSTRESNRLQILFSVLTVVALLSVISGGLFAATPVVDAGALAQTDRATGNFSGALGMGLVFVLLTYGGWNEAAYLSGELRNPERNMSRVLLGGVLIITLVYVLSNLAYLQIFGLSGLSQTQAVGAELMGIIAGPMAANLLGGVICLAALSTINATILTGARVYYALGQDVPCLATLGAWNDRGETPSRALVLQGVITLGLIVFGALTENGISTMVAYTAPVFWLFMLMSAVALIVLRLKDPQKKRPFRVPCYPFTPIIFAVTCLGLLWSSTVYAGPGAIVGLLILAAGAPLLLLRNKEVAVTDMSL